MYRREFCYVDHGGQAGNGDWLVGNQQWHDDALERYDLPIYGDEPHRNHVVPGADTERRVMQYRYDLRVVGAGGPAYRGRSAEPCDDAVLRRTKQGRAASIERECRHAAELAVVFGRHQLDRVRANGCRLRIRGQWAHGEYGLPGDFEERRLPGGYQRGRGGDFCECSIPSGNL